MFFSAPLFPTKTAGNGVEKTLACTIGRCNEISFSVGGVFWINLISSYMFVQICCFNKPWVSMGSLYILVFVFFLFCPYHSGSWFFVGYEETCTIHPFCAVNMKEVAYGHVRSPSMIGSPDARKLPFELPCFVMSNRESNDEPFYILYQMPSTPSTWATSWGLSTPYFDSQICGWCILNLPSLKLT